MHANELEIDAALVKRLLKSQLPQWADLPIHRVTSAGTDNALYRLGSDMVVRLPRINWADGQVEKEFTWLPRLTPLLPLTIPTPLAIAAPALGYPYKWSVYRWLDGENAIRKPIVDMQQAAHDLAGFVKAMRAIPVAEENSPPAPISPRGVPLSSRDEPVLASLAKLENMINTNAALSVWEAVLQVPAWPGTPVWLHGDLMAGNLLVQDGRIHAVIDFGCVGIGDPAVDVMTAWLFLPAETRADFRQALEVDEDTWQRARGWALSVGLIALPYYHKTNPTLAKIARNAIDQVLLGE